MKHNDDLAYMDMAFSLAEKAKGWASPNPHVGSVIVQAGAIVGYGYHERPGKLHAEIVALERAGERAKGSTIYITLEPCVHWGRTPPCIDPVLNAHPRRVVISSPDPNPLVNGKSLQRIRRAGIDLAVGVLRERNTVLNEAYFKYIARKIPFVTVKAALSADGRIAARTGDSRWVSSAETRDYVHLLRGESDAIMTGISTVLKDDPRLTIRHPNYPGKKIFRIVLDSSLRIPLTAKLFSTLSQGRIVIFVRTGASPQKIKALAKKGVDVIELPGSKSGIDLTAALVWLGRNEIASLLVEGGSGLTTSLIEQALADKILLTSSPKLVGGKDSPSFFEGEGIALMKDALPIKRVRRFSIGDDVILEGYF